MIIELHGNVYKLFEEANMSYEVKEDEHQISKYFKLRDDLTYWYQERRNANDDKSYGILED